MDGSSCGNDAPSGVRTGVRRDGIPYEAYHPGMRFVSCLIGQALLAADESVATVNRILGQAIDVLVWIMKTRTAEKASDTRPLHLPSCLRMLFGAALAGRVGREGLGHASAALAELPQDDIWSSAGRKSGA